MKAGLTRIFVGILALTPLSLLGCSSASSPAHSGSGGSTGAGGTTSGGVSAGGATTSPTGSGGVITSSATPASGGQSQTSSVPQGGSATGGVATSAAGQTATGGAATGGRATGGAAGGGSATGGSAAGGSVAGATVTGGSVAGGSVAGGSVAGGSVAGGSVAGGSVAGGSVAGGSRAGGSVAGGSVAGGSVAGGSATGGRVTAGTTTGGVSAGGTGSGGRTTAGGSSGTAAGGAIVIPATGTYPVSSGKPTVYLAGDSTVSTYATNPSNQQGWGQRLQEFFTSDVIVVNKAIGGESSKSFADQGHLAEIVTLLKPGDYLFAQWGINDRSVAGPDRATDPATTFRTYLKQYIDGARGKNAIPVLITPTPRHQYSGGVFQNGFPEYCTAIKAVGTETNTAVIDLQSEGLAYYTSIGDAKVTSTIILNGSDALHFNAEGAYQMARLVALGVQALNLPISQFVIQSKLDGG
jgi:lysophospholipase L1-like esterase